MNTLLHRTENDQILQAVEDDLLRLTSGAAVQWYGRAATALYRAYQIAKRSSGKGGQVEVILPSISCATPANAALLAGVTPRFADIDPATGMLTLESIQQRWTPFTRAVVFIHLFGQTANLQPVASWCRDQNILLIEDVAQALGARLPDGTAAGSVGDLSIYSFNPTKILQCGGGALLIRNSEFVEPLTALDESDPLPVEVDEDQANILALSYRSLHHSLTALLRTRAVDEVSTAFLKIQPAFRSLYLRPMKDPAALVRAWGNLDRVIDDRYRKASQYDEILGGGDWRRLNQWRQSGVCWRYSLLVDFPDELVHFSQAVRRDGFHVSNLYWPVNDFFRPSDSCPNADAFARKIVNLWVDESVDSEWVSNCARSLRKHTPH